MEKFIEKLNTLKLKLLEIFDKIKQKDKKTLTIVISAAVAVLLVIALTVTLVVLLGNNETPDDPPKTEWPEAGEYYYDAGNDEYTLELQVGDTFVLTIGGNGISGSYTLNDGVLTLDFDAENKENASATLDGNVITLSYEGATMRFLKKINYTVKFEMNGADAIDNLMVINGKTVTKPADPTWEGYLFVGWYKDSEFKTPYTFGSDVVTSDVTIYARWVNRVDNVQDYTVSFDLCYDGGTAPEAKTTIGGRLYATPTVYRTGYVFHGWWISTDNDPTRLSYRHTEDIVFTKDTTLYALWLPEGSTKLVVPSVTIADNNISWGAVVGARSYDLVITDSEGVVVFSKSTSATTVGISFGDYDAGIYEVHLVANANTGAEDNSEAFLTVVNRGLDKVSGLFVSGDSTLVFEGVDNAEKYLVTVICGNAEHSHTDYDNGNSKTFSFANCPMTEEGIKFVVKAVADGYLSSVSDEFIYKRELSSVNGLIWNEENNVVSWESVADAEYYMVSVTCGNELHNHGFINNGTECFVDLKECAPVAEGILVKVYPVADGYISPAHSGITINKTNHKTPGRITVDGMIISWEADGEASKFEISVNGTVYSTTENSFDLSTVIDKTTGGSYTVSVRAIGDTASVWSNPITAYYYAMDGELRYLRNTLYWSPVLGAAFYEVQVNDGEIIKVNGGVNSVKISLSRSGANIVKVRFADGDFRSDWTSLSVKAYSVTFDSLGGSSVAAQYLAIGDLLTLSSATKPGYSFISWYNVPGGPYANGKEISNSVFNREENIILYAHYIPEKFEVIYNYGIGGTGLGVNGEVEYERDFTLEIPTSSDITSSFGGWFSEPYGNGVQFTDGSGKSLFPWNVIGDLELYAFWIDETLSFNAVKVNGKEAYAVSAGARISLVSDVTIPAYHNGLPVAMLDGGAFADCKNLKTINMPATVEVVSNLDPFAGCAALTDINVYSVEGIGSPRYWSQDGVLFENKSNGTTAIVNMPMGREGVYSIPAGVIEIPESAFANSSLNKIIIPVSVTKIGNDAFMNCTNLTSVVFAAPTIGESAQELTVGKRAFAGCSALKEIVLPSRLTDIALTKYYVNTSGEVVAGTDYAFVGCSSLDSIVVAEGSATYKVIDGMIYSADGRHLLYCSSTISGKMSIPVGTQSIGAGAFIGCTDMTEVFIPNTVTYIGEYAFYDLDLTKVTFEGRGFSDVTIGDNAFSNCQSLTELVIETGSRVAVIGSKAFSNCVGLKSFSIPATVSSIRDNAFENCTGLASINFDSNGRFLEFGKNVFYNCTQLTTVEIPANVSKIPGIFSGCTSLTEVKVDEDSSYFTSVKGVIFSKDMTEIIYYPQGKEGSYTIPEGVTTIANGVFSGNQKITELVIPNSVSYIGEEAFKGTKIGKIVFEGGVPAESLTIARAAFQNAYFENYDFTLPAHTKHIEEYAFSGIYYNQNIILNSGLETLGDYAFYLPGGTVGGTLTIPSSVVSIGEYCFSGESYQVGSFSYDCFVSVTFEKENSKLTTIGDFAFYQNRKLSALNLPDSVKTIGNYAFYECKNLSVVKLSASLESIGAYAFAASSNTYKLLISEITIPKNVKSIGAHAFEYCQNLVTVNFEGSVQSPDLVLGTTYLRSYMRDGVEMFAVERGNVFASCNKIKTVNLSPNVTVLGDYCFASAGAADFTVNVPEQSRLTTIGAYCFYKAKLGEFTIPATVRNLDPVEEYGVVFNRLGIGEYAFATSMGYLTKITFLKDSNSYPLTIGYFAFENQTKLETIELPARLASYVTAEGEIIEPLANGALVFNGASGITSLTVEQGSRAYKVKDGVLYTADMKELVFCPVLTAGKITLPATLTKIHSYAFGGCKNITEIAFTAGSELMVIGDYSFYGCTQITEIILPTNLTSVGEGAFLGCKNLVNITLPKNLSNFDIAALSGCDSLKNVFVEKGSAKYLSDGGVLYNIDKTVLLLYPAGRTDISYTIPEGVVFIGESAFSGNSLIESVVFPSGLVEIRDNAFANCSSLKTILIPNTVELIGTSAFAHLGNMESLVFEKGGSAKLVIGDGAFENLSMSTLELPARLAIIGVGAFSNAQISTVIFESADSYCLTEIGDNAFSGSSIISIELPSSLVTVGNAAFSGTLNIEKITFLEGLESIGSEAFSGSSIKEIYLPASLKSFGEGAFYNCESLTTVVFADGSLLEAIPRGSFYGCTSLKNIKIPAFVKEIGGGSKNGAFSNCTSLEKVTFESDINCTLIGNYAFYGCTSLSSVEIPKSVGVLGDYAFGNCSSITSITLHLTVTQLGAGLFEGCTSLSSVTLNSGAAELPENMLKGCKSLTKISIPAGVTSIGKDCFAQSGIESFEVAKDNKSLVAIDGILYNSAKTAIVCYPPCSKTTSLVIPKEVVEISEGNFAGSTNLKEVIFEEGGSLPLTIGDKAFDGCYQLRKLVLPDRLISIGKYAFRYCYALTSVNIPKNVTDIADYAFMGCYKLYEVYNESSIENIGSKGSIKTSQPNVNIYTPTDGTSVLFTEGDFIFANIDGVKTLIGYIGKDSDITLPAGNYSVANYLLYNDTSITKIRIPDTSGITIDVASAFYGCTELEAIFVSDENAPSSWATRWHSGQRVIYGYTGEEITYSFVTNGGTQYSPIISSGIITIPTPEREGFVFMGWYSNEALTGEAIPVGEYYSSSDATFYASWMDAKEYDYLHNGGKSVEDAFEIPESGSQTIYVDQGGQKIYFKVKVSSATTYNISITPIDKVDPIITILDANGEELLKLDNSSSGKVETLNYTFTSGNADDAVYYIVFGYYNSKSTGSATVEITAV